MIYSIWWIMLSPRFTGLQVCVRHPWRYHADGSDVAPLGVVDDVVALVMMLYDQMDPLRVDARRGAKGAISGPEELLVPCE